MVEGPEPSQDLSYKWVLKYQNVREIEKGVPLHEFAESMEARELDAEFRLIRKLTETKEHLENQEVIEKKISGKLNRYADLKPCKCPKTHFDQSSTPVFVSFRGTKISLTPT